MEFSPTIVEKLSEKAERHRTLSEQLADPDVASDHKRYTELLREQGQLDEASRLAGRLNGLIERSLIGSGRVDVVVTVDGIVANVVQINIL